MLPGASLPLTVPVAPQQRVVQLGHPVDNGIPAVQEGAPLLAVYGVAEYSPSDAPPHTGPRDGVDCQGLGRYCEGGYLEISG